MGKIIDGKTIAEKVRAEIKKGVSDLQKQSGMTPGLAVVLVGENEASKIYVHNKGKACEKVGMMSFQHHLSADCSADELLKLLDQLNQDPQIHGILVQLPLPEKLRHLDVVMKIDPGKDVDGLHPLNLGLLVSGRAGFRSCTPSGIMRLLEEIGVSLEKKQAVVLGRSNIVGKPIGMMLLEKNATVTYCHSRTPNLKEQVQRADLVVAAVGVPELVKGDWIKPGAVVIDVGINRKEKNKLVGDVEFSSVLKKASYVTPVPGGVGPMTIAMLLSNTLESAVRRSRMVKPEK
jgi:methylenetetrahydrofolate dehydrogenase (NADP+)/methenyltetrahydrofolate cyclohydrolase